MRGLLSQCRMGLGNFDYNKSQWALMEIRVIVLLALVDVTGYFGGNEVRADAHRLDMSGLVIFSPSL